MGNCAAEFTVHTGSITVESPGTTYSVTYLPEDRQISLVVVLDGRVSVRPVTRFDPIELGRASTVSGGWFYFTMPDGRLSEVAGLEPRAEHPLSELAPVAFALGVEGWMLKVRDKAESDDVLPDNWPPELGGSAAEPPPVEPPVAENGFTVTTSGGALADPTVQKAMLTGINWPVAQETGSPDGGQVTAFVEDEPVNAVEDLVYDPDQSLALLEETGVGTDLPVTVLYPAEDELLAKVAGIVIEDLAKLGLDASMVAIPGADLDAKAAARTQAGEPVMVLQR